MSWPMQGPWNPGMGMPMAPDMSMAAAAGAAGYAPEQWTAMQQQNWQQWAQWQQQYAQWQSQYGEKYAQQMQAMQQQMGNAPPLPTAAVAPAPAPPPPDNPPPPPPHENNQPLYGTKPQPNPVPAPATKQNYNPAGYNSNFATGNNQNWTGPAEPRPPAPGNQLSVNAEALKKLAEEERLFDIQFQKWEEEIEKWKRENVNHPDKQAYKEYEDKFEACRKQLMERREQMKQKRARLLSNAPQPAAGAAASTGNNHKVPTAIPPPLQNANMSRPMANNTQSQQYQSEPYKYPTQDQHNSPYQYSDTPQTGYSKAGNNTSKAGNNTVDPQDRYESYQTIEDYSSMDMNKTSFLPTSGSQKSIPGLDLVPEANKASGNKDDDVIEIPDGDEQRSQAPDYTNISKGINSILGDEKIMNILSMVRDQTAPKAPNHNQNVPPANMSYPPNAHMNMPPNVNANVPHNVNMNMPPNASANVPHNVNMNMPPNVSANVPHNVNMNMPPNVNANVPHNVNMNMPPPANANMQQGNQWNRNDNAYGNQQFNNNRPNEPYNRQAPNYPPPLMALKTPYNNDRQGNMPQDYYNNDQNAEQMPRGGPPNMRQMPPGPPQNPPGQNMNQYPSGPYDRREMFNQNDNGNRGIPEQRGMVDQRNMAPQGMPPVNPVLNQPAKPIWKEEPLFTPSIIVEYEHKPLRQKAREFIEPVHLFEYNHKSKDDEYKRNDIEKEVDELFTRVPRRIEEERDDRYLRDPVGRDYERRAPRDEFHDDYRARHPVREDDYRGMPPARNDDYRGKPPMRNEFRGMSPMRDDEFRGRPPMRDDEFRGKPPVRDDEYRKPTIREDDYDRRRSDVRHDERRRDDRRDERDRSSRRDDFRERDRDRDSNRDRYRDHRDDDRRPRSRSRDKDRKRHLSIESERSTNSKKSKDSEMKKTDTPKHVIMIDDILEPPGREMRPEKIVVIMRGPPGSGKSYLAKLIRDKEAEHGGTARIMSIDDYFMQEGEVEEKDPTTGKIVKIPQLKYEYDESLEETYLNSLKRAFKRSITDGYFTFLIYDAVNDQLKSYADIWNFSRQNGFQVYVCTGELDPHTCFKRNIHGRSLEDIEVICSRFFPTPAHHIELDPTNLLQSASIQEVHMEDVVEDLTADDDLEPEVDSVFTSKWEKMDDAHQLARLDGTSKPLRPSQFSMEDYLQLDEWTPNKAKPGKKSVRWADIEERREQEKMRAIGFVVGKTDWHRMTDPTMGSSALTQTKYIERVRRK